MRRQFSSAYEQAISLIKEVKNSNDYLNRAIGVQEPSTIALRLKREQPLVQQTIGKIDSLIQKLEQSYLDPDTARKIGTAKQQFRIQRDRRKQILTSVEIDDKMDNYYQKHSKESQLSSFSSIDFQKSKKTGHEGSGWGRSNNEETQTSVKSDRGSIQMQRQDDLGVNYELEHRMMKQRNEQINTVSKTLMNVHNIIQETSTLTFEQGQKIDIIGEDLFTTYKNVRDARQNMNEANDHQRKARRKYIVFSLMVLLGLAVAVIILIL